MAAAIGTWRCSEAAVNSVVKLAEEGDKGAVNIIEKALAAVESDESFGIHYVGRGAVPNDQGVVQLDAALMDGRNLSVGAVAAIEGVTEPIRVARKVADVCHHSVLVGQGAQDFAKNQGFEIVPNEGMLSNWAKEQMQLEKEKKETATKDDDHDTMCLIVLDEEGNIASGVTTSGLRFKQAGRVGDSPLPGCGYFADNRGGAACATGDGDMIMRYVPCFDIVQRMRNGQTPQQAADDVMRSMIKHYEASGSQSESRPLDASVIAMNMKGETGASTSRSVTVDPITGDKSDGFPYVTWSKSQNVELKVRPRP